MKRTILKVSPRGSMPYYRFYKVCKNDTAVTLVYSVNLKLFGETCSNIKAASSLNGTKGPAFCLPEDEFMYYGFLSKIKAVKYAKAGALNYINKLIEEGEKSQARLFKYREEHFEDLNFNLTESHISTL